MGTGYEVEVDTKGRFVVRNSSTGARHGRFGLQQQARSLIGALPDAEAPVSKKPARARGKGGKLKADDPSTPEVNEAWEGGKAPAKKKRKAKKAKKK